MKSRLICLLCLFVFLLPGVSLAAESRMPAMLDDLQTDILILPEGLKRIESKAFSGSRAERIAFPDSLEWIAPDAFQGCTATGYASWNSCGWNYCLDSSNSLTLAPALHVYRRTEEEIRKFFEEHPVSDKVTFTKPVSTNPYAPGVLSPETVSSALNLLNRYRFVAGLDANVAFDASLEPKESAACILSALNNSLSHYPSRPTKLSGAQYDELYNLGYEGAGKSNLGWGTDVSLTESIRMYMSDSDEYNIGILGHRRWILNPTMGVTAFGYYNHFCALYTFDKSNSAALQSYVAWPAQKTPVSMFSKSDAWSISFGKNVYKDEIVVHLERLSDSKTWDFSSSSADGYFNVNNNNYGQVGCVIFQPKNIKIAEGTAFRVTVTNKRDNSVIIYNVEFFK